MQKKLHRLAKIVHFNNCRLHSKDQHAHNRNEPSAQPAGQRPGAGQAAGGEEGQRIIHKAGAAEGKGGETLHQPAGGVGMALAAQMAAEDGYAGIKGGEISGTQTAFGGGGRGGRGGREG